MEKINIVSGITGSAPAFIFAFIFLAIVIYLAVLTSFEHKEYRKMKHAKKLIEEGHERAKKGNKNDGFYQETKRLKTKKEEDMQWEKELKDQAAKDLELLK
ncbi:hypothetical protein bpr_II258 (plasmid) [Butyrivibrio proteoclasticus B316]|uniref:Uncharacterized protein n=1 Tax=Butyrivibrio proteoclasticus (strain ATCC 51982 / DSM 14932 / B316) TaxID=515622 RepID=E0S463_BUTPB|nr:hypothetical protein [Butyrivibrio proteoclasticus]ADL36195.1 hypothetical protein bpr_II258 [Butyrivibrio proteoclasticus B316]